MIYVFLLQLSQYVQYIFDGIRNTTRPPTHIYNQRQGQG